MVDEIRDCSDCRFTDAADGFIDWRLVERVLVSNGSKLIDLIFVSGGCGLAEGVLASNGSELIDVIFVSSGCGLDKGVLVSNGSDLVDMILVSNDSGSVEGVLVSSDSGLVDVVLVSKDCEKADDGFIDCRLIERVNGSIECVVEIVGEVIVLLSDTPFAMNQRICQKLLKRSI